MVDPQVPTDGGLPAKVPRAAGAARHSRGFVRFLYTSNPFYAISAFLVLWGLWASFGQGDEPVKARALLTGLSGYTLLLAGAGVALIRLGKVWQDVRTVLLLVVLMFLATSVSFDRTLAEDPQNGIFHIFLGLTFAVVVTEAVLWGIGLRLPAWFRAPYYLLLCVFFLYPVLLSPMLHRPRDPGTMWGLFGFSPVATVALLTLLPAARRGPEYAAQNGSPWPWPLYPWVLFGLLCLGLCLRMNILCTSLHAAKGPVSIYRPFFLVPILFAANVLLFEIGLVAQRSLVTGLALLAPLGLMPLAVTGPAHAAEDVGFLVLFLERMGASPLFLTGLGVAVFYAVAAARHVPGAVGALTLALVVMAEVGPQTVDLDSLTAPQPWPWLAAGVLQCVMALRHRGSLRALVGAFGVALGVSLMLEGTPLAADRGIVFLHLLLAASVVVGVAFRDRLAWLLRRLNAALLAAAGLAALFLAPAWLPEVPDAARFAYVATIAAAAALHGRAYRLPGHYAASLAVVGCWLEEMGWRAYVVWRPEVLGLDQILMGLAFFALAVWISLWKTGLPQRWLASRRGGP